MNGMRRGYPATSLALYGLTLILARPAAASVEGRVAAAKVQEESYRHILDDMLYTHAGDDRSIIGAEHDPARDNIAMLFQSYGLTVTLHPFVYPWPEPNSVYCNVVGTKLGTTYPDQEFVIGAHYDSYCWTSPDPAPGADDDASGVALVLEAARVLSAYDSQYTIRFIAFDREEQWMVGSYAYVEDHLADDILGMINADMIAFNPGVDIVNIWSSVPSEPLKLALAQAAPGYADLWDPDALVWRVEGVLPFCDHWPFEEAGFEAISLEEYAFSQNVFYHVPEDNVDSPGYIDYTFATRITRGIVGFLVDQAGVNVDIPNADYDADGDVDADDYNEFVLCFSGSGVPPASPECSFFDFDADGDVDCPDLDLLAAVWTGPPADPLSFWPCVPECLPSSPPEPEMIGDRISTKNRFLSIRAGDPERIQAIRVTAVSLPPPFDIWSGQEWYVGQPRPYCDNAGQGPSIRPDVTPGCAAVFGVYGNEQIWFWGAPLVCDPLGAHYMDWTSLSDYCNAPGQTTYDAHPCDEYCSPGGGHCNVETSLCEGGVFAGSPCCGMGVCGVSDIVHLFHEAIVPSHMATSTGPIDIPAVYDIQVIDSACSLSDEGAYSAPLTMTQGGHGDINVDVSTCPNGPPNGSVGVVTDVVGALNKFSNIMCAMQKARVDLVPCRVDFNISISDVVAALGAFTGGDYADWCGAGSCYCIDPECSAKQCSGGPDDGLLCETDADCSSDPCMLDLSRELGDSRRGGNLPVIDTVRDR